MEEYRQEEIKKIKEQFSTGEGANDADYDPHKYRTVKHGTNYFETLVHVIKAIVGSGILAMPNAFKNSGLIGGFIFTAIVGMICTYGIHLVIQNQYQVCKRLRVPYLSYPSLMRAAAAMGPNKFVYWGCFFEVLVDAFIITFQTGICTVYIIFVSVNLKAVLDELLGYKTQVEIYMLGMFIPFMMLLIPPDLKFMAPLSLISNIIFFLVFVIIIYLCFESLGNVTDRKLFGKFAEVPFVIGTVLFSTAAIGSVTAIEKNMETPKQFDSVTCGILNVAMTIVVAMYISMGFMGYLRFGDETESTITLNLDEKSSIGRIIQSMVSLAVFLSYGLNAYVPVEIVWLHIQNRYTEIKRPLLYNYIMRILFVIFTSITMPLLDLFIAFSGALCMSIIQVMLPALLDIFIKWPNDFGRFYWIFVLNIIVMIIGAMALVAGTYTSVRDIIEALKNPK